LPEIDVKNAIRSRTTTIGSRTPARTVAMGPGPARKAARAAAPRSVLASLPLARSREAGCSLVATCSQAVD
jgi:hypothetical protein